MVGIDESDDDEDDEFTTFDQMNSNQKLHYMGMGMGEKMSQNQAHQVKLELESNTYSGSSLFFIFEILKKSKKHVLFFPSILISPEMGSNNPMIRSINVDFPEPVFPVMPIKLPASILR